VGKYEKLKEISIYINKLNILGSPFGEFYRVKQCSKVGRYQFTSLPWTRKQ